MQKFIIERNMPGAGQMGEKEMKEAANKSCEVLRQMGPEIQWAESFVSDDKIFCVYYAENEALLREHGQKAGFPVDKISKVMHVMDPTNADSPQTPMNKSQFSEKTVRQ
jgi:hypothetical protein